MDPVKFNNRIEYQNDDGQPHRLDGPAIIYHNGDLQWKKNGQLHRLDNKPAVVLINGGKHWFVDGIRHRTDGPAIIYVDGELVWFIKGIELPEGEFKLQHRNKTIKKLLGGKD